MGLARTGINVKRSQVFRKHVKGEFGKKEKVMLVKLGTFIMSKFCLDNSLAMKIL